MVDVVIEGMNKHIDSISACAVGCAAFGCVFSGGSKLQKENKKRNLIP